MKPDPTADSLSRHTQSDADNAAMLSLEQVAQLSGVGTADLKGLVDRGVLTPVDNPWTFRLDCVVTLQRADDLRQDLALDNHGFALAMMLFSQITDFKDELWTVRPRSRDLRAQGHLEGHAN